MTSRHVVIVGLDGVRPDCVRSEIAPNLHGLMKDGAVMQRHIAGFPSETRVNLASLVTGMPAGGHGVAANAFLPPDIGDGRPIDPGAPDDRGRMPRDGGAILASSLGDLLATAGRTLAVLSTGSLGGLGLLGWTADGGVPVSFNPRFPEHVRPPDAAQRMARRHACPPDAPDAALSRALVEAFVGTVWPEHRPTVTILWFAEPDNAQHYRGGPGSQGANEALRNVDTLLGEILDWRRAQPERDAIDLLVVSDHGHVTIDRTLSVVDTLRGAGLRAGRALDVDTDIVALPGRAVGLWVRDGADRRLETALEVLVEQPWFHLAFSARRDACGVDGRIPGSFAHDLLSTDGRRAPHLSIALAGSDTLNAHGLPGVGPLDIGHFGLPVGGGMHGGLHKAEMRCLYVAHGPAFRPGIVSDRPSATYDVLPTVLQALGLNVPAAVRGRVLREIMTGPHAEPSGDADVEEHATGLGGRAFRLRRLLVDGRPYVDPEP